VPIMVPLIVAMAVGPMLPWKRGDLWAALSRLKLAFAITAAIVLIVLVASGARSVGAAAGLGLAAWLFAATMAELSDRIGLFEGPIGTVWRRTRRLPRAAWGMTLAHAGMAVVIAGIAGSSSWTEEKIVSARPGQSFDLAGYRIALDAVEPVGGPDYAAIRADMRLMRDGREIASLHPERRTFANGTSTHVAIRTNLLADVYAVIGEAEGDGAYVLRLYHNPLVPWIWLGAVLMALGGLVSLSDRRHRIGAPARRARPAAPTVPAHAAE
jgi:cytochrome c-type biogenesis protein CcmF